MPDRPPYGRWGKVPSPGDETFWSTNEGFEDGTMGGFWDRLFRAQGIKREFVEAKSLPGYHRWVMRWRLEPTGGWVASMFLAGPPRTIRTEVEYKNAKLKDAWNRRRKLRKRIEEDHRLSEGHRPGPIQQCPMCQSLIRRSGQRGED